MGNQKLETVHFFLLKAEEAALGLAMILQVKRQAGNEIPTTNPPISTGCCSAMHGSPTPYFCVGHKIKPDDDV